MYMKNLPSAFEPLLTKANALLEADPSAEQAIAVLTCKGDCFSLLNHGIRSGSTGEETAFLEGLAEKDNAALQYVVCMWNDGNLDVPSAHFRELLTMLNPANSETEILLKGSEDFLAQPLKVLFSK